MDKVQEKLFELLKEIDGVCQKNDLTYYLGNETALCALRWGHFAENCDEATVFMPEYDYNRFEEITSSDQKYTVESIATNQDFPFTYLHYVDKKTTLVNLSMIGFQKHPGIAIKVMKLVFYSPHENNDDLNDKQALGAALNEEMFGSLVNYPNGYSGFRVNRLKNNKKLVKDIYMSAINGGGEDKTTVYLQQHRKRPILFDAAVFEGPNNRIEFEGFEFPLPADYKRFISILYGRRWRTREIEFKPPNYNLFIDTNTPYESYFDILQGLTGIADKYREKKIEKIPISKRRLEITGAIQNQTKFFDRTADKWSFINKYLPYKDYLMALYRDGDFFSLSLELSEYQVKAEKNARNKLPFAFDKDLFYVLCDIFNWQGLASVRRKMLALRDEAFKYLDSTVPENEQILNGSLYSYISDKKCLEFIDGSRPPIPLATEDELKRIAILLQEEQEDDESIDSMWTSDLSNSRLLAE